MNRIQNHLFYKRLRTVTALFLICVLLFTPITSVQAAGRRDTIPYIILASYHRTIAIDEQFHLVGITSNGKLPTFRSSNSKIASVNTYGLVTGKKAGTVTITAKI
ncbi:MAG: Ig-like domain-containing protein, partial [bacterium]|nr:Ig-like domain-containing protein [bacterium]